MPRRDYDLEAFQFGFPKSGAIWMHSNPNKSAPRRCLRVRMKLLCANDGLKKNTFGAHGKIINRFERGPLESVHF